MGLHTCWASLQFLPVGESRTPMGKLYLVGQCFFTCTFFFHRAGRKEFENRNECPQRELYVDSRRRKLASLESSPLAAAHQTARDTGRVLFSFLPWYRDIMNRSDETMEMCTCDVCVCAVTLFL